MHRRFRSFSLAMLTLSMLFLPIVGDVRAADGDASADAPFVLAGLDRSTIVVLLGEPDKIKRADGKETLIYKLLTVGDDHLQAVDERLVDLPGIGR